MAKIAGSPCSCPLKHLLTLSRAQQALTHSLFSCEGYGKLQLCLVLSPVPSKENLNGSPRRSHKAPNCSRYYIFSQFNILFVYYVFILCLYYIYIHDHTRIPEVSQEVCTLTALLAFAPGLHRRYPSWSQNEAPNAAPLHGRKGWKVGRRSCTWHIMAPLKRSNIFHPKFRIRRSQAESG